VKFLASGRGKGVANIVISLWICKTETFTAMLNLQKVRFRTLATSVPLTGYLTNLYPYNC